MHPGSVQTSTTTPKIDSYLARIGWNGLLERSIDTLRRMHRAHVGTIPFENVDVLLRRPSRLDSDSLHDKMVGRRRGGYCFEQNLLFKEMAETVGFEVCGLAARVRMGSARVGPRGHMLLLVKVANVPYVADVGFGALGLLEPIPLVADLEFEFPLVSFKLTREGDLWVLHAKQQSDWTTLYAFTLEPQERVDYEVQHFYTSTHPDSSFLHTLTAQLVTPEKRLTLRKNDFATLTAKGTSHRPVNSSHEAISVLSDYFGLNLPLGTRFPDKLFQ